MKKLAIAGFVAMALPVMVNAQPNTTYILNDAKNTLTLASSGLCYGVKFTGKGKITTLALPLQASLSFGASDQANANFTWQNDFLLNNVDPQSGAPAPSAQVLTGTIAARKNNDFVMTFAPVDQLKIATALVSYAGAFTGIYQNAQLDPDATKNATPYVMQVKLTGKTLDDMQVTETAYVKSTQGACTANAKIIRKYKGSAI